MTKIPSFTSQNYIFGVVVVLLLIANFAFKVSWVLGVNFALGEYISHDFSGPFFDSFFGILK